MKKSLKTVALLAATGAMIAGSAFSSSAASLYNGQWCQEANGWWYKLTEDGKTFLANTWYWIKDTDGNVRCYYFDPQGWLVTNTTVDGCTIDENGRWVDNGVVQTDNTKDYATSVDFAKLSGSAAASDTASYATVSSKTTASTGNKKAVKVTSAGDDPNAATFESEYGEATINGTQVINSWANYTLTLPGTPKADASGSGTDWYYEPEDDGELISSFIKLDKYTSGNTDLASFIKGYLNDKRGAKGYTDKGSVTLGAFTFEDLSKYEDTPDGSNTDHLYVRIVDGTNFVQVIELDDEGDVTAMKNALLTLARVQ